MFSKGASIVGPITALGPIWLVYYLASSEVPTPVVVEEKTEDTSEKKQEKKTEEEQVKEEKQEEAKKEEPEPKKENETLTKEVLKTAAGFFGMIASILN